MSGMRSLQVRAGERAGQKQLAIVANNPPQLIHNAEPVLRLDMLPEMAHYYLMAAISRYRPGQLLDIVNYIDVRMSDHVHTDKAFLLIDTASDIELYSTGFLKNGFIDFRHFIIPCSPIQTQNTRFKTKDYSL